MTENAKDWLVAVLGLMAVAFIAYFIFSAR